MRLLKATVFLGALLSTGILVAQQSDATQAQTPGTSEPAPAARGMRHAPNPDHQARMLTKKLGLSSDQQAQIKPILADRQQQMEALRADTSLSPQDRRAKAQQIMQDSKTKIEAVLNDQQKQQFEQMQAESRARRNRGNS